MLGFICGLALDWYYFNFMENNSYLKNVSIYAVINFIVSIIQQAFSGTGFTIISSIIGSIVAGLIMIKIMEFARSKTNNLLIFIIISELCYLAITFIIAFIVYKIFS